MEKKSSKELFIIGENLATTFLTAKAYTILERNWRCPKGEIDIIAQLGETLIFVEVKTRRNHSISAALANVSYTKQKRITLTAQQYINQIQHPCNLNTRFDIIIVIYHETNDTFAIHHLENAYLPPV